MDRLTKLYKAGRYGLVKVKDNEQEVDSPYPNTLRAILESFQRLGEYENTNLTPAEIVAMREDLKGLKSRWEETASDGTGYTLSHLDGIYALADEHGAVLCEFIRDAPSSPVAAIPAPANHVLSLSQVLALPDGARVWVEERYGGGRGGAHFRAKKDGDADVLRRADNPDNGCWLKEPFFGDYWRVWSLPVAPTEDELAKYEWEVRADG